jgi:hypothetical protein
MRGDVSRSSLQDRIRAYRDRDDRNHALRYTTYNSETAVLTIERLTLQAVVYAAVWTLVYLSFPTPNY